uniref:MAC-inhibitory protein n=1 Tax=Scleropages formosus TaxID=113540 RepID=A0A8C9V815_SCLFO
MKYLGICLLFSLLTFSLVSGLRCYKCTGFTGQCSTTQDCTTEDACLSLSDKTGTTYRQCIRYTDCDNSRLSQMFPAVSSFTYRCCNSNLCNSSPAATWDLFLLPILHHLLHVSFLCVSVPRPGGCAVASPASSAVPTPASSDQPPALEVSLGSAPALHPSRLVQLLGTEGGHAHRHRVPKLGVVNRVSSIFLRNNGHEAAPPKDFLRRVGGARLHGDARRFNDTCQYGRNSCLHLFVYLVLLSKGTCNITPPAHLRLVPCSAATVKPATFASGGNSRVCPLRYRRSPSHFVSFRVSLLKTISFFRH